MLVFFYNTKIVFEKQIVLYSCIQNDGYKTVSNMIQNILRNKSPF